jgi:peptide chain release factor 3
VQRRRTFGIISHPDAGKTTLTEKLLLFSGAIQMAGTVKARKSGRHATSDWMEIEKQRGISVASSVMQFEFRDHVVNLLDTPGHQDFSEDTYRVLTAVDSALMVIDAAKGVEAQTIKLRRLPHAQHADRHLHEQDGPRNPRSAGTAGRAGIGAEDQCAPVTWPIGMGKNFRGVYHLLNDRSCCSRPAKRRPTALSKSSRASTTRACRRCSRWRWISCAWKWNWCMALPSVQPGEFLAGVQTPVFFGSAINNFGVREILSALVDWAPAPRERDATVRAVDPTESRSPASCSRSRPIWTRRTATASPSCACARAVSSAA